MTKEEILDETLAYYKENRPGFDYDSYECHYMAPDGCMCAVGRCLYDASLYQYVTGDVFHLDSYYGLESILKPEYLGHSIAFWSALQMLHDGPIVSYWDADLHDRDIHLSKIETKADSIRKAIHAGKYD